MGNRIPVRVVTVVLAQSDTDESQRVLNWQSPREREWLKNHMHWAIMNGRGVALTPLAN